MTIATKNQQVVFKVLGSGCKKCNQLEANVQSACEAINLNAKIEHERDFVAISNYGILSTPALVLNEEVVSSGKVLTVGDVKAIIKEKINAPEA
ncbi:thioredoxin family protein [Streptococcus ferus]|uniref:thioredoxin family protein n=1 Tax=Streptococcus ferus TaxID=1345 RepID=UPI002355F4DD|nr:thioredoxin family protein [Streptococcus ferus]